MISGRRFCKAALFWGNAPGAVGIVFLHRSGNLVSLRSKIFLVHASLLVYDKCHHPGHVVLRRPGYQRETANHIAIDDVIVCPTGGVFTLSRKNAEIIAMKWFPPFFGLTIAGLLRFCDERPKRAFRAIEIH